MRRSTPDVCLGGQPLPLPPSRVRRTSLEAQRLATSCFYSLPLLCGLGRVCRTGGRRRGTQNPEERLIYYCRTISASTAPCTSRRMCRPTHCNSHYSPCQPLLRALFGWIRPPPPTPCLFFFNLSFLPFPSQLPLPPLSPLPPLASSD